MKKFAVFELISKIIQYMITAILIFMVLLMFTEVLRRYIWSVQFIWSEEFIRFLAVWVAFLGGAAAYHEKALVCFDLISGKLHGKGKLILDLITNTIMLVLFIFILYLGMKTVMSPSTYMQKSTGMKVSMAFPYAAIPVGTAFMIIFSIENYISIIQKFISGRKEGNQ